MPDIDRKAFMLGYVIGRRIRTLLLLHIDSLSSAAAWVSKNGSVLTIKRAMSAVQDGETLEVE